MAMAMGNPDGGGEDEVNSTINTTPLVDVMLVLLIIFLITVPVVTHTVKVELPKERNQIFKTHIEDVDLSVTKDGDVYWGQKKLADNNDLLERLKAVSVLTPQPEVHIRGDQTARYEFVGRVILTAQRAGIAKVGFVVTPPAKN
jgi:biopolymer transport protein ExbD